jgi:hypothetical protein
MVIPNHRRKILSFLATGILAALCFLLYLGRSAHCVLYYYGASPAEVPQGTAVAILNPLRNRKDERNAEWLIRDLRTDTCEAIARGRLGADPAQVCPVMRGNSTASLIWLDPEGNTTSGGIRKLIYDLPDKKARLIVYFGADEAGWGVKTISVVR